MSYTTATFARIVKNANGSNSLYLAYTGNASEPTVEIEYPFDNPSGVTADYMRAIAMARLTALNVNLNFYAGAQPNVGNVLDTTTPLPAPAAPTFGAFAAAAAAFTPGATAQDVFTITGSSTRTVQVQRLTLSTTQTTAGTNAWFLVKRSTANSGGTSAGVTAVPLNDVYPAATATVLRYTANPTAGTLIGGLWSDFVPAPTPAAPLANAQKVIEGFVGGPIILSGTTDVLALNFGAAAIPSGLSVLVTVWWTET